ncbi:hypothetical protein JCM6882_001103 [Rhodosporidiobolus microsporus]
MVLVPTLKDFEGTLALAHILVIEDPAHNRATVRLLEQMTGYVRRQSFGRVPGEAKRQIYDEILDALGPAARHAYLGDGTMSHTIPQGWDATALHISSAYDHERNAALPAREVRALVRSWDPRTHGHELEGKHVDALRCVAGVVKGIKDAEGEPPSLSALLSHHPDLTPRRAGLYGFASGGAQY